MGTTALQLQHRQATVLEMKEIPVNVSESVKRRNPHLYGVRPVEAGKSKPASSQALDNHHEAPQGRAKGLAIRVTFIVLSRRLLDSDNLQGSLKPLRDAIAKSIGIDDGASQITWEYMQQKSEGKVGVVVKVDCITSADS